tara:strand:- start:203 stop:445 length:243 start_codon:yes stop_codon:yes gene_type:complete
MTPLEQDQQMLQIETQRMNNAIDILMAEIDAWRAGPRTSVKEYKKLMAKVDELTAKVQVMEQDVVELEALELHHEQGFIN